MTGELIKTVDIGPFTVKKYKEVKLKKYNESSENIDFVIGYIYNHIGNNIETITERRLYYLNDTELVTDIHYYCSRKMNVCAINRNVFKFGVAVGESHTSIMGEPVWIAPPDADVHEYNNEKRKHYFSIRDKLNLYISGPDEPYVITKPKIMKKIIKTTTNSNGFQVFNIDKTFLDKLDKTDKIETGAYKPPGSDKKINTTLVVKNVPTYLDRTTAYQHLKAILIEFGNIQRITVLQDKHNPDKISGMAFVDFYNINSVTNILNSKKRFVLEHNILQIEKSKKKK